MGDTFQCLLGEQFKRLRVGDRFWHENEPDPSKRTDKTAFTQCQLREVRKCRLAKIICDNGDDISAIPRNVLQQSKIFLPCDSFPEINLNAWRPNFQCSVSRYVLYIFVCSLSWKRERKGLEKGRLLTQPPKKGKFFGMDYFLQTVVRFSSHKQKTDNKICRIVSVLLGDSSISFLGSKGGAQ